jgi:hypothetical protein
MNVHAFVLYYFILLFMPARCYRDCVIIISSPYTFGIWRRPSRMRPGT